MKQVVDLRSEEEIIQSVRKHLLDVIRIRLKANVPVALYLSGGIGTWFSNDATYSASLIQNYRLVGRGWCGSASDRERERGYWHELVRY